VLPVLPLPVVPDAEPEFPYVLPLVPALPLLPMPVLPLLPVLPRPDWLVRQVMLTRSPFLIDFREAAVLVSTGSVTVCEDDELPLVPLALEPLRDAAGSRSVIMPVD